jgi:hypothetical protein
MGGFVVQFPNGQRYRVHPKKLVTLFQEEKLSWPDISDEEIKDRSKAN